MKLEWTVKKRVKFTNSIEFNNKDMQIAKSISSKAMENVTLTCQESQILSFAGFAALVIDPV